MIYNISYEYELEAIDGKKSVGKGQYKQQAFNLQEALTIIAINVNVKITKVKYVEVNQ